MKKEKFLTVYALLDVKSEMYLASKQKEIINAYPFGTQTMGIPFHITLGSFPVEQKEELIRRIKEVSFEPFSVDIEGINHFNYQVIFVEPKLNEALLDLHNRFACAYADGFSWVPHITLYCGSKEACINIFKTFFVPKFQVKIIGIEMQEFFPPKHIITKKIA